MKITDTTGRQLTDEDIPFIVKEIFIREKSPRPFIMDGGAICLCTEGAAEITMDTRHLTICKGCELILLPDSSLFIKSRSEDFRMLIFIYSKDIWNSAAHKFSPSFFSHIYENPAYLHPEGCEKSTLSYLNILEELQNDIKNRFSVIIATNLLRSMMLNVYDKVIRHSDTGSITGHSRKEEIFKRFIRLINESGRKHREVAYYAGKLCITTRYLTDVTKAMTGETPKEVIDSHIIQEVKLLLTFSDMTIQQIADYLHFPDQSYLGRFFKHHTSLSPTAYRKNEMAL